MNVHVSFNNNYNLTLHSSIIESSKQSNLWHSLASFQIPKIPIEFVKICIENENNNNEQNNDENTNNNDNDDHDIEIKAFEILASKQSSKIRSLSLQTKKLFIENDPIKISNYKSQNQKQKEKNNNENENEIDSEDDEEGFCPIPNTNGKEKQQEPTKSKQTPKPKTKKQKIAKQNENNEWDYVESNREGLSSILAAHWSGGKMNEDRIEELYIFQIPHLTSKVQFKFWIEEYADGGNEKKDFEIQKKKLIFIFLKPKQIEFAMVLLE